MSNLFEKQNKPFAIKLSERVKEEIEKTFKTDKYSVLFSNYSLFHYPNFYDKNGFNGENHIKVGVSIGYTLIAEADFFGDGSNKLREKLEDCAIVDYVGINVDKAEEILDDFAVKFAEFCNDLLFNCSEQYDGKTTTELLQIFKTKHYGK